MSMLDNLTVVKDSTVETLKTRLGDPILGSYIISFLILNWEAALYLFSDKDVSEKITSIKEILYPTLTNFDESKIGWILSIIFHPFILPALFTAFYLLLFPLIFRKAHQLILKYKVSSENDRFKAEEMLSPIHKKINELQIQLERETQRNKDLSDLRINMDENIQHLKEENQKLRTENTTLISERVQKESIVDDLTVENENLKDRLHDLEIIIEQHNEPDYSESVESAIQTLEIRNLVSKFKEVASDITNSYLVVASGRAGDFIDTIPIFDSLGIINRVAEGDRDYWKLTEKGRKVLARI